MTEKPKNDPNLAAMDVDFFKAKKGFRKDTQATLDSAEKMAEWSTIFGVCGTLASLVMGFFGTPEFGSLLSGVQMIFAMIFNAMFYGGLLMAVIALVAGLIYSVKMKKMQKNILIPAISTIVICVILKLFQI